MQATAELSQFLNFLLPIPTLSARVAWLESLLFFNFEPSKLSGICGGGIKGKRANLQTQMAASPPYHSTNYQTPVKTNVL